MRLQPRKRFGQHFLVDLNVIADIHKVLHVAAEDRVLEIGAGQGQLTRGLVNTEADLVVVEIDRELVRHLRQQFVHTTIVEADVLSLAPDLFSARRIVGNLPYGISTPLLLKLYGINSALDLHFMLQKELADRLVALPNTKAWGRLSVKIQHMYNVTSLFEVPPEAFEPVPAVASTFIRFDRKENPLDILDYAAFNKVLTAAFTQRRKKVSSSLREFNIDWEAIEVEASLRADQLHVEDYVKVANSLPPVLEK